MQLPFRILKLIICLTLIFHFNLIKSIHFQAIFIIMLLSPSIKFNYIKFILLFHKMLYVFTSNLDSIICKNFLKILFFINHYKIITASLYLCS